MALPAAAGLRPGDAGRTHRHQRRVRLPGHPARHGRTGSGITLTGGGRAKADLFDDPFFFDLQAFRDQVKGAGGPRTFCDGTPVNFFNGLNVSAIVLQVPIASLGGPEVGVWARTRFGQTTFDRMGRPAAAAPNDAPAQTGLAASLSAQHEFAEALDLGPLPQRRHRRRS